MNATNYGRGQMVIPAQARRQARLGKGDVVSVQPEGDGRLILVRLEKPNQDPAKIRIVRRRGRHAVGLTNRVVAAEEVQKFIDEFP
jgi:AbrB family looped-hinge helix DNA binding protein